jgi:hypothetical protein
MAFMYYIKHFYSITLEVCIYWDYINEFKYKYLVDLNRYNLILFEIFIKKPKK